MRLNMPPEPPKAGARALPTWLKVLMSLFAVVNLLAVLFANEPDWSSREREQWATKIAPVPLYRARQAEWMVRYYSYFSGLDNYWTLFSVLPRFNHWYWIKAHYADGSEQVLPLPMQSQRTFWQKYLFDFRTAKYYLNIYRSQEARQQYLRQLCQDYPRSAHGSTVVSITMDLYHRNILDRETALSRGTTMEPQSHHQPYGQVSCVASR